jgi:hypothetical protein
MSIPPMVKPDTSVFVVARSPGFSNPRPESNSMLSSLSGWSTSILARTIPSETFTS